MKTEAKRCTARGKLVKDTRTGAPTEEKLADGQLADHYVLCADDRAKGYVEPYRDSYIHEKCGTLTRMPRACAETYAVQPEYYGRTFCCGCGDYFPVGENGAFDLMDEQQPLPNVLEACASPDKLSREDHIRKAREHLIAAEEME